MNEKEKAVVEAAVAWFEAKDMYQSSQDLIERVKDLIAEPVAKVAKNPPVPEKSIEVQLRCIDLFGYPRDQYVLKGNTYVHKSVA